MPFEFKLADLGEGIQEGEIVRWLVAEGDMVAPDQPLVEVMTDKVTTELPSPVAGRVVGLEGEAGDIIPVGATLVLIDTEAEGAPHPANSGETERVVAAFQPGGGTVRYTPLGLTPPAETPPAEGPVPLAVPAVRKLAKDLGVDLSAVKGSGPGGRILDADVRAVAGAAGVEAGPPEETGVRRIPLRGLRRVIAEHLLDSHRNTAPYTYVEEVDFTELVGLRDRVQPLATRVGVRLTYLPFIVAAVGMALREHPMLNATVDPRNGDLVVHDDQHIAIAVHTDDGLFVPVIKNVERRNLLDLAREIERLSTNARQGRLSRDEILGGTFSVTSLGNLGGLLGTPMLNTPQVAVLGIHKISPHAVVRDGVVVSRQTTNLSLTLDHRYIDGYVGARFAQTLRQYLEDPAVMLFWLAELRGEPGLD